MQLHLKQTYFIFFIFFLCQTAFAQRVYQPVQNVPIQVNKQELPIPWAGGLNAAIPQTADLDGDGQEELIIFDRSSHSFSVFAWVQGSWHPQQELACLLPPDITNWFIMQDYDGDGQKDIFTYTAVGIRVFRNTSSGDGSASWELVENSILFESNERMVNLLVNSGDIPAIEDVDGDGDMDILVYDPSGGAGLEYFQNQSVERTGAPDQFLYTRESRRWGGLAECNCEEFAFNGEACKNKGAGHRVMHSGGKALLLYDVDGDGDYDLLNGFELCQELYYLENKGSNTEPYFDEFSTLLPGSSEKPELAYPAAFSVDAEQDGRQDLIISSQVGRNNSLQHDYSQSVWWYKPTIGDAGLGYQVQTRAFLQEKMLDAGEWSVPTFADVDADGDQDMLLGTYGKPQGDGFYAGLQLFTNTGSAKEAVFGLANEDFLSLKNLRLMQLKPQFVDFNKDGSLDLLLLATETQTYRRKGYLFLNKASSSAHFNLQPTPGELTFNFTSQDNPFFFDLSGDGLPDLLLGRFDGSLSYFENTGTAEAPAFETEVKNFLGLGLDNYRRNLVPSVADLTGNNEADLLLADATGSIRYVENISAVKERNATPKDLVVCEGSGSWFGGKSWPVAVALRQGEAPMVVVGNLLGGLWLLHTDEPPISGEGEGEGFQFMVFPNPVFYSSQEAYIVASMPATIRLFSVRGQLLREFEVKANVKTPLLLAGLADGVYVVQAQHPAGRYSRKLILLE